MVGLCSRVDGKVNEAFVIVMKLFCLSFVWIPRNVPWFTPKASHHHGEIDFFLSSENSSIHPSREWIHPVSLLLVPFTEAVDAQAEHIGCILAVDPQPLGLIVCRWLFNCNLGILEPTL